VTPVPQSDGPNPVVTINYSSDFRELMDIFRAVLVSGEKTQRVLELTEEILDINAANYTVWEYRRQTLAAMGANLYQELDFMDTFAEENPKNYQIWFHRRVIVERLGDPRRELDFTKAVFQVDGKNYHAWSHRQWTLVTFGLWDGELDFIDSLLQEDIRNNSAWNQRWFVVHHMDGENGAEADKAIASANTLRREYEYAMTAIDKVKSNESAWNYLRGLWNKYKDYDVSSTSEEVVTFTSVLEARLCELRHQWVEELDIKEANCLLLYELLADILSSNSGTKKECVKDTITELYSRLRDLDIVRSAFWQQRVENAA